MGDDVCLPVCAERCRRVARVASSFRVHASRLGRFWRAKLIMIIIVRALCDLLPEMGAERFWPSSNDFPLEIEK